MVRKKLAQNLVFLFMNLENDHSSDDARKCLEMDQDGLLQSLQLALHIPVPPKRTSLDKTQSTSLVRALLKLSRGKIDFWQYTYAEEYTASENTDFYTSLFNITTTRQFGDFVPEKICKTLSSSLLFSEMAISVEDLEERTTKIIVSLCIGF